MCTTFFLIVRFLFGFKCRLYQVYASSTDGIIEKKFKKATFGTEGGGGEGYSAIQAISGMWILSRFDLK